MSAKQLFLEGRPHLRREKWEGWRKSHLKSFTGVCCMRHVRYETPNSSDVDKQTKKLQRFEKILTPLFD